MRRAVSRRPAVVANASELRMMFDENFAPLLNASCVPFQVVWLDPERNLYAVVDDIDYSFAVSWMWRPVGSKSGVRRVEKWYACRTFYVASGAGRGGEGRGRTINVWLHKEILLRAVGPDKRRSATIGDHINGNSLDCRRSNLRWATSSENRRNLYGSASHQLKLGFKAVLPRHVTGKTNS